MRPSTRLVSEIAANELSKALVKLSEANEKIATLEAEHTELINEVLRNAPECMDGDAAADSIAIDYVRSLEGEGGGMTGHRDECECYS